MERLPSSSTPSGGSSKKIKFSKSEVQTLIEEVVRSAMKKNEAKLQNLEKAIQPLNSEVDYESTIEKLETHVKMLTRRVEAVLANMTKTQKKLPLASCVNLDVSRTNSEDFPVDRKDADCMDMSRDVLQIMNPLPSHVNVTLVRTHTKDETMEIVSQIDRTASKDMNTGVSQENENNFEEFTKLKECKSGGVKQEYPPSGDANCSEHTHSGQEQDEVSFPPLPTMTFPSTMSIEAASYNMPRRLTVHLALIKQPAGLCVLWNVEEKEPSDPPMDSYSIYITMEKAKGCSVFTDWKTLNEVKAAPLPMYEWIPKYKPGHKMCVAVVGKDKFGRYGPYSKVVTAVIPE